MPLSILETCVCVCVCVSHPSPDAPLDVHCGWRLRVEVKAGEPRLLFASERRIPRMMLQ